MLDISFEGEDVFRNVNKSFFFVIYVFVFEMDFFFFYEIFIIVY